MQFVCLLTGLSQLVEVQKASHGPDHGPGHDPDLCHSNYLVACWAEYLHGWNWVFRDDVLLFGHLCKDYESGYPDADYLPMVGGRLKWKAASRTDRTQAWKTWWHQADR